MMLVFLFIVWFELVIFGLNTLLPNSLHIGFVSWLSVCLMFTLVFHVIPGATPPLQRCWLSACCRGLSLAQMHIRPSLHFPGETRHLRSWPNTTLRWGITSTSSPDRGLLSSRVFLWFFLKMKWLWKVCAACLFWCTGMERETSQILCLQMCWWGKAQRASRDQTISGKLFPSN